MLNNYLVFCGILSNIGSFLLKFLVFCIVLGVIVGIHEFGHMIFALKGGILCREYSIGMGPKIVSKKKGEILYSLRCIPLGGFCSIAGETEETFLKDVKEVKLDIKDNVVKGIYLSVEDEKIDLPKYNLVSYDIYDENDTGNLYLEVSVEEETKKFDVDSKCVIYIKKEEYQIAPHNRSLDAKSKKRRALVMFGGPLMNFVLAIICFLIVGLCSGFPVYESSKIGKVNNKDTYELNLQEGDEITKLSCTSLEKNIGSWNDITKFMDEYDELHLSEKITITFNRDNKELSISSDPFIAINNCGFGSYCNYSTNGTVIGAYEKITDLGDNTEIQIDDKIVAIWTEKYSKISNPTWGDIRKIFDDFEGDDKNDAFNYVYMTVERDGNNVDVKVKPYSKYLMKNQTSINGSIVDVTSATIGINPQTKFNLFKSFGYAFKRTGKSFTAVISTFKLLFKGSVSVKNLSGPIGIYSITSSAMQYGPLYILSLIGLLSVNIGFMNLLPIPALDGGRLAFVAYEAITKKKPSKKVEDILITVTFVLLLGLMILVGYEDILRLLRK